MSCFSRDKGRVVIRTHRTDRISWWDWGTESAKLDIGDVDNGIKAILLRYRPIFPEISKHAPDVDVYLEIVVRCSENEQPRGMYLSAETVHLISELGAAVDIDVVPLVQEGL